MTLFGHIVLVSFVALITMVNPLAAIPSFIALTDGPLRRSRRTIALIAALGTTAVLLIFLTAGNLVFKFFGITVPAFQTMGGILFLLNAIKALSEDEHRIRTLRKTKKEEERLAEEVEVSAADPMSVAIVPLAIPLLSGPGAITAVMVLVNLYHDWSEKLAVATSIAAVGAVSWLAFLAAVPISHFFGERGRAVFNKIMALLLGAIGVQFVFDGIKPLMIEIMKAS